MLQITSDIHTHTFLSSCAGRDSFPEKYLEAMPNVGIKTVGISDHYWDEKVEGASDWYIPQNTPHVLMARERIKDIPDNLTVLFGCEAEFIGSMMNGKKGGSLAILPETAELFDYVIISANHFQNKGLTVPKEVNDPWELACRMVSAFKEAVVCQLPVPVCMAHPFIPYGMGDETGIKMLDLITDDIFRECFSLAAENDKSIEVSAKMTKEIYSYHFLRMLRIAKTEGCKFHFASDNHSFNIVDGMLVPSNAWRYGKMAALADLAGIREEDIFVPQKRI